MSLNLSPSARLCRVTFSFSLCLSFMFLISPSPSAQSLSYNREMGRTMLRVVQNDIKKNYYDPSFHGIDLDANFKAADEKIKQASSLNEVLGIIAATVMDLNDSHTYFLPPRRATRVQHGWEVRMIGDKAFIIAVQPGSDAEARGLQPGDRVISLEGVAVTRKNMPSLQYIFYLLAPRTAMKLQVEKPNGQRRELTLEARVFEGKVITNLVTGMASDRYDLIRESQTLARLYRHRYYEIGDDVMIWKMPQFDLPEAQVNDLMDKARKRKALVLDLRGNGGGRESTLLSLIGSLFDHDVKIGELKGRSEKKLQIAKGRGKNAFTGTVVVLTDSDSASASEVFARVMQQEKRAVVIGDRSAGLVMRGKTYWHQFGQNLLVYYGMEVTDADVVNPDGKSLEHVGVTPDEVMLPTADDLAAGRDPVLAHAAKLAGLSLTPEKAGTLFPVEWRK
jgi:C-terminal processing protease CtpA/Prc